MPIRFAFPKTLIAVTAAALLLGDAAGASVASKDACNLGLVDRLVAGPLLESAPVQGGSDTFVVLYSGDGGWAKADCSFAQLFGQRGVPVLGVNSVRYFGSRRTPQAAAADLSRWIETYSAKWGRPKVILMGYSFGASALPIIAEHLPPQSRARVTEVALAGPGAGAELVLRPRTWFNKLAPDALPVEPAVAGIRDLHVLCIYGAQDTHAVCPRLPAGEVVLRAVAGTHRFQGSYEAVVDAVVGRTS